MLIVVILQKTVPDLGERMLAAFEEMFEKGYEKAVIIGSDCAELQGEHIATAFEQLDKHDFVIGPANDGGYYLLGMKKLATCLFESKKWSTNTVFEDTIKDIQRLKKTVFVLPPLNDLDRHEDLLAVDWL